jgi:hypothetical protein
VGKKKHSVNMMFTILLLGIFALAAIFVAVMGAKVYANSADKMQANFDTRTSIVYLSEKIRTCPNDNFSVRDIGGNTALVLTEEINGREFESWIFVQNDRLSEVTVLKGDQVYPNTAQQIMDLRSLDAEVRDGGIEITVVTVAGDVNSTFLSGRTAR